MSKRDCASGAEGKKVSEKKRKLPWPPGDPGQEFVYIFTGEEQIGCNVEVMRTVKGREVKAMCEQGERGNLIAASVQHGPHVDNEHNFLKSAVKYCLDNPLHAVGGGLSKFWGWTAAPPRGGHHTCHSQCDCGGVIVSCDSFMCDYSLVPLLMIVTTKNTQAYRRAQVPRLHCLP